MNTETGKYDPSAVIPFKWNLNILKLPFLRVPIYRVSMLLLFLFSYFFKEGVNIKGWYIFGLEGGENKRDENAMSGAKIKGTEIKGSENLRPGEN